MWSSPHVSALIRKKNRLRHDSWLKICIFGECLLKLQWALHMPRVRGPKFGGPFFILWSLIMVSFLWHRTLTTCSLKPSSCWSAWTLDCRYSFYHSVGGMHCCKYSHKKLLVKQTEMFILTYHSITMIVSTSWLLYYQNQKKVSLLKHWHLASVQL